MMTRLLNMTPRQRIRLVIAAFLSICFLFVLTDHLSDRHIAINLDQVYDRPLESNTHPDGVTTHGPSPISNSTRILIVSALFPLKRSKHGYDIYPSWVKRFLGNVTTDLYFFCSEENAQSMRDLRPPGLPMMVDTTFSSPFDTPPLRGLQPQYETMHKMDREKDIHSPELYAVWNAKPFLTDYATKILAAKGEYYNYIFWNDAGSFRENHVYKEWPYGPRVEKVWSEGAMLSGLPKEDLLFYATFNPPPPSFKTWQPEEGPLDVLFSEGSFFGGSPKTIEWWAKVFYGYLDYCTAQGYFCGKDESVFNAVFLMFPKRLITVWVRDPDAPAHGGLVPLITQGFLGMCGPGPDWFYYQWWLSDRKTRDEMREMWMDHDHDPSHSRWWMIKVPCRFTRVLSMLEMIQRTFKDPNWEPPVPVGIDFPDRQWTI